MDLTLKQQKELLEHFPEAKDVWIKTTCIPSVLIYVANDKTLRERFIALKPIPEYLAFNWAYFIGDHAVMVKHIKTVKMMYQCAEEIDSDIYRQLVKKQKTKITKQQKEIKRLQEVIYKLEYESGKYDEAITYDALSHYSKGAKKNSGWTS